MSEPLGSSVEEALERWKASGDLFDAFDLGPWSGGEHGAEALGEALARIDQLRQVSWSLGDRMRALESAARMASSAPGHVRGTILQVRGDLRLRQDDLAGAALDYDNALSLFKDVEDRLGQANVLQARGDLAREQDDLPTASRLYLEAMEIYEAIEDGLGLSNVLAEIARVLAFAGQREQARTAAERALAIAVRAHNTYARKLADAVLAAIDDQTPA